MNEQKKARMEELVTRLNQASKAYYQDAAEIMSNYEYDALYDELLALEAELGITLSNSPTVHVGYEVSSELPKERHESPMLSLDKTKDVADLVRFVGDHKSLLSWKMDGLTIVLTYRDGALYKAVTRGNGEVGEVITANARVFVNIPLKIQYKDELILRGEAVIGYQDFERINAQISEVDAKYKNPRNLCSGSVRQLNSEITAQRNVKFYAFSLVSAPGVDFHNSRACQLNWLKDQGFQVVEFHEVTGDTVEEEVIKFSEKIAQNDFPSDGLVLIYDDIAYGVSLGRTAKYPRDSFAFKWADETAVTTVRDIEWSPSRTGLINPVAVFDPVELEGTSVSRASVHNISIMEDLSLGVGDEIEVYKANMIIPQIARNLTGSGVKDIPDTCPVCGGPTQIRQDNQTKSLYCVNPACQAKHVKAFALLVSRDALNIEGLSESTLEKLIGRGWIKTFADIFHLDAHRAEMQAMEGFGEKSVTNLLSSIQKARHTSLYRVVYGIGIVNIGLSNAKVLCRFFDDDFDAMRAADVETISQIPGIGAVIAASFVDYFSDQEKRQEVDRLLDELTIEKAEPSEAAPVFAGMNFVITGTLNHFTNRSEAKEMIERLGGKVTASVTAKTTYLINNDVTSTSSKNTKAKELGIPILSEEEFLSMMPER